MLATSPRTRGEVSVFAFSFIRRLAPRALAQRRLALVQAAAARGDEPAVEIARQRGRQRAVRRGVAGAIDRGAIALRHVGLRQAIGAIGGGLLGHAFAGVGPGLGARRGGARDAILITPARDLLGFGQTLGAL